MHATESARKADHLDDHACADLVLGLPSGAEREAALAHAAACPPCEARLRAHASAAERAAADLRTRTGAARGTLAAGGAEHIPAHTGDDSGEADLELPGSAPTGEKPAKILEHPTLWRARGALTLSAAALLLFAVAWPLVSRAPYQDRAPWLPPAGEPVRTREGETEDPRIAAGLAAYEARDFETANRELSAARATGATELMRRLYLGHVRLERGDSRGAVAMLSSLEWKLVPEPWRREGVRVLARALRHDGDAASADSIERALRQSEPTTPFVP